MKFTNLLLILALLIGKNSLGDLKFGFLPNDNAEESSRFSKALEKYTGEPVKVVVSKNYQDLIDGFKNKEIDFAFFSSFPYIEAVKTAQPKVLFKKVYKNGDSYYSILLVRSDSNYRTFADLKNKKIAFVDKKSTSGFLYPLLMLKQENIPDINKYFSEVIFSGTHEESIKMLEEKKVDVVAVWAHKSGKNYEGAWTKFSKNPKAFYILKISKAIPNDPFCVREDFYKEAPMKVFKVMEGFYEISKMDKNPLKTLYDIENVTMASDEDYGIVKEVSEILKLDQYKKYQ